MQENNADRSICFTEVMMWPMTCEIGEEKICRRTKQTEAYVLQKSKPSTKQPLINPLVVLVLLVELAWQVVLAGQV